MGTISQGKTVITWSLALYGAIRVAAYAGKLGVKAFRHKFRPSIKIRSVFKGKWAIINNATYGYAPLYAEHFGAINYKIALLSEDEENASLLEAHLRTLNYPCMYRKCKEAEIIPDDILASRVRKESSMLCKFPNHKSEIESPNRIFDRVLTSTDELFIPAFLINSINLDTDSSLYQSHECGVLEIIYKQLLDCMHKYRYFFIQSKKSSNKIAIINIIHVRGISDRKDQGAIDYVTCYCKSLSLEFSNAVFLTLIVDATKISKDKIAEQLSHLCYEKEVYCDK